MLMRCVQTWSASTVTFVQVASRQTVLYYAVASFTLSVVCIPAS